MRTNDILALEIQERNHWWHRAKKELIFSIVQSFSYQKEIILEIGAGSGSVLNMLKKLGEVSALDQSQEALALCRKKGITNCIFSSFEEYHGKPNSYTIIIAADVLEHIAHDADAVKKMYALLKPGGRCIIHVPARPELFSYWDTRLGHFRRYNLSVLTNLFVSAGFHCEFISYRLFFLYPFVWIFRKIRQHKYRATEQKSDFEAAPFLNDILLILARLETYLLLTFHIRLPIGVSIILIARK